MRPMGAIIVWSITVCAFHRNRDKDNYATTSQACVLLAQTERRKRLTRTLCLASYFASETVEGMSIKFGSVSHGGTAARASP